MQLAAVAAALAAPANNYVPRFDFALDAARAGQIRAEAAARLPPDLQFDASQQAVADFVNNGLQRGLCILGGGPGCGKSVVARYIVQQRALQDGVVLMASTHAAAELLSEFACTVHSTANIPVGRSILPGFDAGHRHAHSLATCHTFIWDEFSMSESLVLTNFLLRLCQAQGTPDVREMLQRNTIFLVGDCCQLPPVCSRCPLLLGVCPKHNLIANHHFEAAYHSQRRFELEVNHRNPGFAHTLNAIRRQHQHPLTQVRPRRTVLALALALRACPSLPLLCRLGWTSTSTASSRTSS